MIKIVAIDMDGTLLNENGFITENTKKTIENSSDRGVFIVAATGRCWDEIPDEMLTNKGMRYAILSNGARIVDLQNDRTLYSNLIESQNLFSLLSLTEEIGVYYHIVSEGSIFVDERFMKDVMNYFKTKGYGYSWMSEKYRFVKNLPIEARTRNMKVEKITIEGIPQEKMNALTTFFSDCPEFAVTEYAFRPDEPVTLEIGSETCSKGQALKTFCTMFEFDEMETMAIGDGFNDVSLLSAAGFAVAMGNAVEPVKAIADYVTLSNREEGVALAIKKFAFL